MQKEASAYLCKRLRKVGNSEAAYRSRIRIDRSDTVEVLRTELLHLPRPFRDVLLLHHVSELPMRVADGLKIAWVSYHQQISMHKLPSRGRALPGWRHRMPGFTEQHRRCFVRILSDSESGAQARSVAIQLSLHTETIPSRLTYSTDRVHLLECFENPR